MKSVLFAAALIAAIPICFPGMSTGGTWPALKHTEVTKTSQPNLIIVTLDGFRWQELFHGADSALIGNTTYTQDTGMTKLLYWASTQKERRERLMPFCWSVIASKEQLYGNRDQGNKLNTANIYSFSYPGYNEIFTGSTDLFVASNKKKNNRNHNLLEFLHNKEAYKGKVVAFTSWDVFPYILNEERSGMLVNSGHESLSDLPVSGMQSRIEEVQEEFRHKQGAHRQDELTYLVAKAYLEEHRPRVMFLGFGETDEFAHAGRYDLYLEQANKIDRILSGLWRWIQTTEGYRDNTHLIITTDHGRGSRTRNWTSHSSFIQGSSQTWVAVIGPTIAPLGEVVSDQQHYQQDIAAMMAGLLGERFDGRKP
jgi:hypothetical protein